jgi:hypothetical protein
MTDTDNSKTLKSGSTFSEPYFRISAYERS